MPAEALHLDLESYAGQAAVPALYSAMPREALAALGKECERPSAGGAGTLLRIGISNGYRVTPRAPRRHRGRGRIPLPRPAYSGGHPSITQTCKVTPPAETPGRRRAAFLRHFSRCRTLVEAAARTGIDARTVRRWRRNILKFAERCEEIIAERRRQAVEDVVMAADHVETRPIFYRGKKVGEYTRREAADFEARVQEEVERWLLEMSASAEHRASRPADELSSLSNDLEPAERTVSSRAGVRENVRMSGARRLPPMSAFAGHPASPPAAGVRAHVPMSGAFPPRRPDEEEELPLLGVADELRHALAKIK